MILILKIKISKNRADLVKQRILLKILLGQCSVLSERMKDIQKTYSDSSKLNRSNFKRF